MSKYIQPVGARSLIKAHEAATESANGLLRANSSNAAAAPVKGIVIAAGTQSAFKVDEVIFFRRYSVDELKIVTENGEEVVTLVDDEDVLATEIDK